jgi:hypothetical protein
MSKRKAKVVSEPAKQLSGDEILEIQNQFRIAVDANDIEKVALALYMHSELVGCPKSKLGDLANVGSVTSNGSAKSDENESTATAMVMEDEDDPMLPYYTKGEGIMRDWKQSLVEGDFIDVYRKQELVWYTAKIIYKEGDVFSMHYNGWAKKYDDHEMSFSECQMFPCGTAVKQKKPSVKKAKAVNYTFLEVVKEEEEAPAKPAEVEEGDRAGRRARAARVDLNEDTFGKKAAPAKKKQKTKEEEDYEDSMRREWVCSVCSQLEAPDGSDLILCDGLCKRSFHLMCLNLSEVGTVLMYNCRWIAVVYHHLR